MLLSILPKFLRATRYARIFDFLKISNAYLTFSLRKREKIPATFESVFLIVNGMRISALRIESLRQKGTGRKGRVPGTSGIGFVQLTERNFVQRAPRRRRVYVTRLRGATLSRAVAPGGG